MSNVELTRGSCIHAYIVCRISDRRSCSTRDHSSQLAAIQVPFYHPDKPAFHSSDQHGTRRPADNYFPIMIDNPPARYAFRFTRPASYLSPVKPPRRWGPNRWMGFCDSWNHSLKRGCAVGSEDKADRGREATFKETRKQDSCLAFT